MKILKRYSWPGNVRQLASVVEKHIVQATGRAIYPEDLDLKLYQPSASLPGGLTLEEFESEQSATKLRFILDTIEAAGSKAEAARRLGISPAHLQYMLGQSKAARTKTQAKPVPRANELAHVSRT